jgi:DNA-binding CsgD family transcriptional regulator
LLQEARAHLFLVLLSPQSRLLGLLCGQPGLLSLILKGLLLGLCLGLGRLRLLPLRLGPLRLGQRLLAGGAAVGAPAPARPALAEPLSARELEILGMLASGLSNRDIAQSLYLTVGTVKTHVHNLLGKLEVESRTQAIARSRELGLLKE